MNFFDIQNDLLRENLPRGKNLFGHSQPFPAISNHFQPFPAIPSHSQPFPAIPCHSQPLPAIRMPANEIFPPCRKSTIEQLLTKSYKKNNVHEQTQVNLNFTILSKLLSVLTTISVGDQPLPKYRYASAGSLYPVQIYIAYIYE
jgi:UDP:flavonoid glycosyltransferase YjiC (YdhE family)